MLFDESLLEQDFAELLALGRGFLGCQGGLEFGAPQLAELHQQRTQAHRMPVGAQRVAHLVVVCEAQFLQYREQRPVRTELRVHAARVGKSFGRHDARLDQQSRDFLAGIDGRTRGGRTRGRGRDRDWRCQYRRHESLPSPRLRGHAGITACRPRP